MGSAPARFGAQGSGRQVGAAGCRDGGSGAASARVYRGRSASAVADGSWGRSARTLLTARLTGWAVSRPGWRRRARPAAGRGWA